MSWLDIGALTITVVALAAASWISLHNRRQAAHLIASVSQMLDQAIDGSFTETTFDESSLSALEARVSRYLSISALSAKNLTLEKEKLKSLIADISHQTKTPLANILLYSELLQEQNDLPLETNQLIRQISRQTEKLNFLIEALVKISRLESGLISVTPGMNSILKLVESAVEEIVPRANKKAITILTGQMDGQACFDPKWTAEAIINLLDNAVKYSPSGGEVKISLAMFDFFARIDITDTGIGIHEDELSRIFSRFYRSPNASLTEGVGIGLFLAREIISAQRGYIQASSKIGKGSTFSVFLPRECS